MLKGVVNCVSVFVPNLRLRDVAQQHSVSFACIPPLFLLKDDVVGVRTGEATLTGRVIPRKEVIQPGLNVPFLAGELLAHAVTSCIAEGGAAAAGGGGEVVPAREGMVRVYS